MSLPPMVDMLVRLYDLPPLEPVLEELQKNGVVIRRAMPFTDKTFLVKWVRDIWGQAWADECNVAFSYHPISCFVAVEKGTLLGFGCYDTTKRNFFGPTGVHEKA